MILLAHMAVSVMLFILVLGLAFWNGANDVSKGIATLAGSGGDVRANAGVHHARNHRIAGGRGDRRCGGRRVGMAKID